MKHLVFLTLSLTKGGAERVISNMCNDFFVGRCRVTVISLMKARPEYALHPDIRLIEVDGDERDYLASMPVRFARRRKKLKRLLRGLKKEGAQAVISFLPEPNMLACSLKRAIGMPVVISVRNAPAVEYGTRLRYLLMRLLYPRADAYVFQTKEAKAYFSFSRHITARGVVIPNPLSAEFIGDAHGRTGTTAQQKSGAPASGSAADGARDSGDGKTERDGKKESFLVLAVGRLEAQKNYGRLLAVFQVFHEKHRESSLMICGEGSERAEIGRYVKEHSLGDCVSLPGNVDDIAAQYEAADAYLMTSDYEGMPNALIEAMACGLPVVVTDCPCGAPAELVHNEENGILVPMGNEKQTREGLIAGLERLYAEPDFAERLAQNAQNVRETLAPNRIYAQWDRLIGQVTAGKE